MNPDVPDFSEDLLKIARSRMPFGKYAGRYLMDLPENYVLWFSRKGFPDGDIGRLLSLLCEIQSNSLMSLLEPLRVPQMNEQA